MKKACVILVCVLLLAVLAVPTLAAEVNLTASVSATTVQTGDEVVITISSSGTTPFTSLGLFIEYDTSVFEFKSRSWGVAIVDATTKSFSDTTGKITAVWDEPGVYSGEIIKITLTVKGVKPKNTTIKFGDLSCKNINDDISIEGTSAQVSLICQHTYGEWTDNQNGKHSRICSKCQDVNTEAHDWNDGAPNPDATCTTPGTMEYNCLFCSATKTEDIKALGHKYDNDCDASCNRTGCGYTRTVSHKYGTDWQNDKNGHWHKCTVCGNTKDYASHTPAATTNPDDAKICSVCQYEISPAAAHEHEMSEEWITDAQYHWHRCQKKNPSCYQVEDKAEHDYDDDCDISCNTCGYIREAPHNYTGEWKGGQEGHWDVCATCGARSQTYPHEPGPEATQDAPQICVECNFTIKMPLNHVHDFGEVWYDDEEYHWQSCTDGACLETTEKKAHDWDDGVELDDGSLQYTCSVCGKQTVTAEPMPEPTVPSPSVPDGSAGEQNGEQEGSGSFPWQWAGIAAVVLLVIGIVLLVIEYIRSRKVNSHGRFSK